MRDEAVLDMAERGLSTSAPRGTSMPQMSLLLAGTWSHRGLGQGSSSCWDPWHIPSRGAEGQQEPYCSGDL